MNNKERHYLHGDEKEGEKGIYFCAACDLFFNTDQFYSDCIETNGYERYQRSLKHWNKLKKQGTKHQRPENPENLFK